MTTPEIQQIHCVCCMQKHEKRQDINFHDYCRHVCNLNTDQVPYCNVE